MVVPGAGKTKGLQAELHQLGDTAKTTVAKLSDAGKSSSSFAQQFAKGFGGGAGFALATSSANLLIGAIKGIPQVMIGALQAQAASEAAINSLNLALANQ